MVAPPPDFEHNLASSSDTIRLCGELRAEVQDLQAALEHVRKGEATIKSYATYIEKTKADIIALIEDIKDGDTIRHLHNIWEQMAANPLITTPQTELNAQEQLHYLNMLSEQVRNIELLVGTLTIPERLNTWLAKTRPGYYIPFHVVFEDELPVQEDRIKVLNYLALAPEGIKDGIVDTANGLIYRYSADSRVRRRSIELLVGAFVLATALVIVACYLPIPGWPLQPQHVATVLTGWGAVLIGTVVHVAISSVKRRQLQGSLPPVVSIGDFSLVLNARIGQILSKLLLGLIGFFGLVFASGIANVTPLNSFLVGYSLDSVVEVFGASVEQQAAAQVAALKQQLGITSNT